MSAAKVANTNNFEKGLRARAEKAEAEIKRLEAKLSATRTELAAAQRKMPLAVLEGLRVATSFFMDSDLAIEVVAGRDFADAARAAAWVKQQYADAGVTSEERVP